MERPLTPKKCCHEKENPKNRVFVWAVCIESLFCGFLEVLRGPTFWVAQNKSHQTPVLCTKRVLRGGRLYKMAPPRKRERAKIL